MPHPITGVNRFTYDLILQGNYGYGWEDLCEYADPVRDRQDAKDDLKAHRENETGYSFRLITRRVLNPEYDHTPADYLLRARNLRSMANIAKQNAGNWRIQSFDVTASDEWRKDRAERAENSTRLAAVLRQRARLAVRRGKALRDKETCTYCGQTRAEHKRLYQRFIPANGPEEDYARKF